MGTPPPTPVTHVPAAVETVATMAFASSGLLEVAPKRLNAGVPAIVACSWPW